MSSSSAVSLSSSRHFIGLLMTRNALVEENSHDDQLAIHSVGLQTEMESDMFGLAS